MCYSPEADLVAGLIIGGIGVDAVRHADDRPSMVLASVPLVLATHQLIEAVAWSGLLGRVPSHAGEVAVTLYLVIALGVVPVLVPSAVALSEPSGLRRSWMHGFVALGIAVSLVLLYSLATGPHGASIGGRFIAYEVAIPAGGTVTFFYVVAVCAPLLFSSHRRLALMGALNLPVVALLSALIGAGLISLWCMWAAVTSLVVARHVRKTRSSRTAPPFGDPYRGGLTTKRA
jgi:hypothetical protein